ASRGIIILYRQRPAQIEKAPGRAGRLIKTPREFRPALRHLFLRLHAPELKALLVDRLLDGAVGKLVRRFLVRTDDAGRVPRRATSPRPVSNRSLPRHGRNA